MKSTAAANHGVFVQAVVWWALAFAAHTEWPSSTLPSRRFYGFYAAQRVLSAEEKAVRRMLTAKVCLFFFFLFCEGKREDERRGRRVDAAAGRPRRLAPRADGRAGVSPRTSGGEGRDG